MSIRTRGDELPEGFPNHPDSVTARSLSQHPMRAIVLFEYYDDEADESGKGKGNNRRTRNATREKKPKLVDKQYFVGEVQKVDMGKCEMTLRFQEDGDTWTVTWREIDYVFHNHTPLPPRYYRLVQKRYDEHGGLLRSKKESPPHQQEEVPSAASAPKAGEKKNLGGVAKCSGPMAAVPKSTPSEEQKQHHNGNGHHEEKAPEKNTEEQEAQHLTDQSMPMDVASSALSAPTGGTMMGSQDHTPPLTVELNPFEEIK